PGGRHGDRRTSQRARARPAHRAPRLRRFSGQAAQERDRPQPENRRRGEDPARQHHPIQTRQRTAEPSVVSETVLVLDFGSQYTQLIARRIREQRVYSVVLPFDTSVEKIRALNPKAIICSGGPQSVYAESAPI